jgi:hypothetical protein
MSVQPDQLPAAVPGKEAALQLAETNIDTVQAPKIQETKTLVGTGPGGMIPVAQTQEPPQLETIPLEQVTPQDMSGQILRDLGYTGEEPSPNLQVLDEFNNLGASFKLIREPETGASKWYVQKPDKNGKPILYSTLSDQAVVERNNLKKQLQTANMLLDVPELAINFAPGAGWAVAAARMAGAGAVSEATQVVKDNLGKIVPYIGKMQSVLGEESSETGAGIAFLTGMLGQGVGELGGVVSAMRKKDANTMRASVENIIQEIGKVKNEAMAAEKAGVPADSLTMAILSESPSGSSIIGKLRTLAKDDPQLAMSLQQKYIGDAQKMDALIERLQSKVGLPMKGGELTKIVQKGGQRETGIDRALEALSSDISNISDKLALKSGNRSVPENMVEELVFKRFEEAIKKVPGPLGAIPTRTSTGGPNWEAVIQSDLGSLTEAGRTKLRGILNRVVTPALSSAANGSPALQKARSGAVSDALEAVQEAFVNNAKALPGQWDYPAIRSMRQGLQEAAAAVGAFEQGGGKGVVGALKALATDFRTLEGKVSSKIARETLPPREAMETVSRLSGLNRAYSETVDDLTKFSDVVQDKGADLGNLLLTDNISLSKVEAISKLASTGGLPIGPPEIRQNLKKELAGGMLQALREKAFSKTPILGEVEGIGGAKEMLNLLGKGSIRGKFESVMGKDGVQVLEKYLKFSTGLENAAGHIKDPAALTNSFMRTAKDIVLMASYLPQYQLGIMMRGTARALAGIKGGDPELVAALGKGIGAIEQELQRKAAKYGAVAAISPSTTRTMAVGAEKVLTTGVPYQMSLEPDAQLSPPRGYFRER